MLSWYTKKSYKGSRILGKCWSNVTVYTVRRFITTRRLLQKLRSIGSFLHIRLPQNEIIYLAHLHLYRTLFMTRYFFFVSSRQVYLIINSFTRIKIKKIHDYPSRHSCAPYTFTHEFFVLWPFFTLATPFAVFSGRRIQLCSLIDLESEYFRK